MRYFVVVDRRKIQKTAENREPETPWQGVALWEYLLHLVDSFNRCQHLSTSINIIQPTEFSGGCGVISQRLTLICTILC